eukprot:scaffold18119_cov70-Cyclotella_meneghiniana.AAC.3
MTQDEDTTSAAHTAAPQSAEPVDNNKSDVNDETTDTNENDNQEPVEAAAAADNNTSDMNDETSDANDNQEDDNDNDHDHNISESEESEQDDDSSGEEDGSNKGPSTYELARLERIKRNQERLASLGLTDGSNIPQKKKTAPKPRKKSLEVVLPTRELPSRAGRATFMESFTKKKEKVEDKMEGKNLDICFTCQIEGGASVVSHLLCSLPPSSLPVHAFTMIIELISCDYCRALYHPKCHPEITSSDVEGFRCQECEKVGKKRRVACGFCDGCKREDDCGTCVVCVVKQSGSKTKHKCIFRKCQSWGKDVMKEEDGNDGEGESDDHHDSVCDKCKEGGDGRWTCMYCTVKPVKSTAIVLPKYSRPLIADTGDKEMTVTVRWPVLVCKVCSDTENWMICRACGDSYHLKCFDPTLDHKPKNVWRCPPCKENKKAIKEIKINEKAFAKPKNEKLFEGVHDDDCYICYNGGGELFKLCHIPPLVGIPKDSKAFGGPNRLKQGCELKKCPYMRLAPPASRKSITGIDVKQQFKQATEKLPRKRKEPSSLRNEDADSKKKKLKHLKKKKSSIAAAGKLVEKKPIVTVKPINSLDMVETSLANDTAGSKIRAIISTAIKEIDNPLVAKHACQYLRVFITDEKSVDKIIRLGCLLFLAKAMYLLNDTTVYIEAIKTLTKMLVRFHASGEEIFGSGCVALAIEIMKNHSSNIDIQQAVCVLLRAVSTDFRTHPLIVSAKGVEAVSVSLKTNSNKLDTLLDGFYFLQTMLCNPGTSTQVSQIILTQSLISIIADGIVIFPQVAYLRAVCSILANLAIICVSRNGADVDRLCILRILSILSSDVDIDTKRSALHTLKALSTGKQFVRDFPKCDGIRKVADVMMAHPHDNIILIYGLQLFTRLMKSEDNAKLFADADGLHIITNAMQKHRKSEFVQTSGCIILRRLSMSDAVKDQQVRDAIELMLSAMKWFQDDDCIQFDGRHALLNLISQKPSFGSILQVNGIRQANMKIMAEDMDTTDLVSDAEPETTPLEDTMKDFQSDEYKEDPVCKKIQSIIGKALNNTTDSKAQYKSCEQLRVIMKDEESAEKVIQLNGIAMIVDAMNTHPEKTLVQAEACAVFSHMIWEYPVTSIRRIAAAGCLPLIVKALNTHTNHNKVQQYGLGVFHALSFENVNHYFINSVDGLDVVLNSMSENPEKIDILQQVW